MLYLGDLQMPLYLSKVVNMVPSAALLVPLAALLGCAAAATDYCMAQDPNPFASFGTRAPYEASGANLDAAPRRLPGKP